MKYQILFCLVAIGLMVGTVSADTVIVFTNYNAHLQENSNQDLGTLYRDTGDTVAISDLYHRPWTKATTTNDQYDFHYRVLQSFGFNSTMPAGSTVSAATLSIYGYSKANALGNVNLSVIDYTGANPSNATGYSKTTFTRQASDVPYASFTTAAWNNIALTNLSQINTTSGNTTYLLDLDSSVDNRALTWSSIQSSFLAIRSLGYSSGAYAPYITVTYTSGATPPVASFTIPKTFLRIPNSVTVTDTSTNTPTSWAWSWGDGTANSTTQNPSHQYLKRGKWDIILTATNAGGSGTSAATSVKVVGYENYY